MKRLDDLCRSERYFTATLLPALLMRNPETEVVSFVTWMEETCGIVARNRQGVPTSAVPPSKPTHVEIVTELNMKRDLKAHDEGLFEILSARPSVQEARAKGTDRQSVPDIVLLVDDLLVVIEGKFFVRGVTPTTLNRQLLEQREEIAIMLEHLGEGVTRVAHIYLGPTNLGELECDGTVTWSQLLGYAEGMLGADHYVVQRLAEAVRRYDKQGRGKRVEGGNYQEKVGFQDMLKLCREHGAGILIGFDQGEAAVSKASREYLEERVYKVDYLNSLRGAKNLPNWIAGDRMLVLLDA